jgi:hypothetical protein
MIKRMNEHCVIHKAKNYSTVTPLGKFENIFK